MITPPDSKTDYVPTRPNTPSPDEPVDDLVSALINLGIDLRPIVNARAAAAARAIATRRGSIAVPAARPAQERHADVDDTESADGGHISDDSEANAPAVAAVTAAIPPVSVAAAVPAVPVAAAVPTIEAAGNPVVGLAGGHAGTSSAGTGPNTGFACANCHAWNPPRIVTGETAYVVTVGLQVGVFTDWHVVQGLVSGVSGACYRKYASRATAQAAFTEALNAGVVVVMTAPPAPISPRNGPFC
ncbi:hypothetical protein HYPSUDRAFT_206512 [Hypholoma sublateritium FD-334 SS-4]|uniref:Ribonuclease H1 N-terminal domain-containing protein n=1 Tax=Hypholoma sublateritium (strain FD-334 SS-4) TaxID=945553 RepID=A0A0D2NKE4_HYPSF|nr:hypothetical protein HYPSUDRAFT_206512 [Hypholoma sublateritium FD-334 SS-4]